MSNSIKKEIKNALTVGRIADYCLVSRSTVRRWLKDGRLNGIRLPSGHYRISIVDFRDFLERWHIPVEDWLLESKSKKKGGKQ
jgi:excisionase family DNA binding protein